MKTPKESAVEWLNRITSGDIVKDLTEWIEQDRAEQREACADAAYARVKEFECVDSFMAKGVMEVCLNAGVEE